VTRLRLSADPGAGQLDGGWWPRSTDVTVELQQLLAALPPGAGRVSRVALSMADWPLPHPTRSVQRGLPVKVGWFRAMEPHTVTLGSSSAVGRLLLLVVPPDTADEQAERDLVAVGTPTPLRATALLAQATPPAGPRGAAAALHPVTTGTGRTA
jgi:hypothetical protein